MRSLILILFSVVFASHVYGSNFKFEGVLGQPVENINNMNANAQSFIPYNPVIVEIGAFEGAGTLSLARTYCYGKVFAFEPHPETYSRLVENTKSFENVSPINLAIACLNGTMQLQGRGSQASLPLGKKGGNQILTSSDTIDVPSVVLDDWCKWNKIDHIDFLRLDIGGQERQILESSPEVLRTVLVVVTKTYLSVPGNAPNSYYRLRHFLETQGFELLSHWYEENKEGEATFVRKYLYDSLFR